MRVLGIEGTAWAASAAVYDSDADAAISSATEPTSAAASGEERPSEAVFIESDAYEPDSGGIHPREAAEHMHEAIPRVVETALEHARELQESTDERESTDGRSDSPPVDVDERRSSGQQAAPVDAVAFSRGPGLGPCLRIVGTAARALSQTLEVPLVGVNHMVAHLEIGRHTSGFESPVCLNASGANAHLLAYRNGRYRVLGETMDTGIGNAIDKFTRHVGWSHPGGPKVEAAAKDGEYVDLPYVVKGMDFSFSGIMSAAKQLYDDGVAVEDICYALQENVFAMLTEVAERALSLTGSDELVLGGGVGQNARLREMLAEMCDQRGADFHAPEPRFLRDNAGMIAVLGAKMFEADDTLDLEDSRVDPNFRPDQVPVTWRGRSDRSEDLEKASGDRGNRERTGEPELQIGRDREGEGNGPDGANDVRGAEALVALEPDRGDLGRVTKNRRSKSYRHPELDERLRRERTRIEAKLTNLARREGVPTPVLTDIDARKATLEFEYVGESDLRESLTAERVRAVGRHLATLHRAGFVHGDPTTRNVRVGADRTYLIDFGLGYHTDHVEDYAMDIHVFDQSLVGTADDPDPLREALRTGYRAEGGPQVLERLEDVEGRGRYVSES